MTSSVSPGSALRPLRSVLIAGAAAVAWLSFSAPAADATTQQGQNSLLGGSTAPATLASSETTSPSFATQAFKATDPAAPVVQPDVSAVPVLAAPSKAVSPGVLPAPVTDAAHVPTFAGEIVAPVETAAGSVAETVSQTAVAPAAEAAPVLAAPLKSVSDVISRAPSLIEPVAPALEVLEEVDAAAAANVAEALPATSKSDSGQAEDAAQSAAPTAGTAPGDAAIRNGHSSIDVVLIGASGPAIAAQSFLALTGNGGAPAGHDNGLGPVLPAPPPGSGAGNGQSSGGPFASAAWLTSPFEHVPPAGLLPVNGPLQHIHSPIALEPGSSPD